MLITYQGSQFVTIAGQEFTVDFSVQADMSFTRGVISGPPENCFPDEGACDITETMLIQALDAAGDQVTIHPEASGRILSALDQEKIEQGLWDAYHEAVAGDDYDPPDGD